MLTHQAVWGTALHVTYVGNSNTSGTAPVDPKDYAAGQSAIVLGPDTLKRTGYTLAGWGTNPNGPVVHQPGDTFVVTADISLFAIWTPLPIPPTGDLSHIVWLWLLLCATFISSALWHMRRKYLQHYT